MQNYRLQHSIKKDILVDHFKVSFTHTTYINIVFFGLNLLCILCVQLLQLDAQAFPKFVKISVSTL